MKKKRKLPYEKQKEINLEKIATNLLKKQEKSDKLKNYNINLDDI
jgi:hypothetical protein